MATPAPAAGRPCAGASPRRPRRSGPSLPRPRRRPGQVQQQFLGSTVDGEHRQEDPLPTGGVGIQPAADGQLRGLLGEAEEGAEGVGRAGRSGRRPAARRPGPRAGAALPARSSNRLLLGGVVRVRGHQRRGLVMRDWAVRQARQLPHETMASGVVAAPHSGQSTRSCERARASVSSRDRSSWIFSSPRQGHPR
jgi:hypothetical protein